MLGASDPAFGAAALNSISPIYNGSMVVPDGIHLWTWDARPYPAFPAATDVWSDAANWETGHWLTGRLGSTPLDALVLTILADSGVIGIDSRELGEGPDGYVVDLPMAPRAMLDPLALAFAFDAFEQDGVLRFRQRGGAPVIELTEDDLVLPEETPPTRLTRKQEGTCHAKSQSDLPTSVLIISGARLPRDVWPACHGAAPMPTSPLSPMTAKPAGARKSGCRIYGPAAKAQTLRCRRAGFRLALATLLA